MSTGAIIGMAVDADSVEYVSVRMDGNPDVTGELLLVYYNTPGKIKLLLALGNVVSLDNRLADCIACNEPKAAIKTDGAAADVFLAEARKCAADYYRQRGKKRRGPFEAAES